MKKSTLTLAAVSLALTAMAASAADPVIKICHENEDSYPWIFKDKVGLTTWLM